MTTAEAITELARSYAPMKGKDLAPAEVRAVCQLALDWLAVRFAHNPRLRRAQDVISQGIAEKVGRLVKGASCVPAVEYHVFTDWLSECSGAEVEQRLKRLAGSFDPRPK
jgi:hypothetical protein